MKKKSINPSDAENEAYLRRLPYRPGIGLMILNEKLEIFVGKRVDTKGDSWQMPQGGIDIGEAPEVAAMREMKEEIGTNNAKIIAETKQWYKYDLPQYLISKLWNGSYRGQRQKWFLLQYSGTDEEIDLKSAEIEFIDWKWVEIDKLTQIIVPFKRKLYIAVIEEFRDILLKLKAK